MEYHVVAVGLLALEDAGPGLSRLAAEGWRIISVNVVQVCMVWTLQREVKRG